MLTGSVCIPSNTRAAMNTLQTVAPIPAFKAGSILAALFGRASQHDLDCRSLSLRPKGCSMLGKHQNRTRRLALLVSVTQEAKP